MKAKGVENPLLLLVRHGASMWNEKNLFTGWVDVPLSERGIEEARRFGEHVKDMPIDVVFCSALMRAQMTAMIALARHSSSRVPIIQPTDLETRSMASMASDAECSGHIPVYVSKNLNERAYGDLQGLDKGETERKFGRAQVQQWRRSYNEAPPNGESLAMTQRRVIPYFTQEILQFLEGGRNVLICAHGNSLRALIQFIEGMTEEQVVACELSTGVPVVYRYHSPSKSFKRV